MGMGADCVFYEIELAVEENLVGLGIQDLIHDGVNMIPVDLKGGLVRNKIHQMIPVLVDIDNKAQGLLPLLVCLWLLLLLLLCHFERGSMDAAIPPLYTKICSNFSCDQFIVLKILFNHKEG
jgi:hypothetical protein